MASRIEGFTGDRIPVVGQAEENVDAVLSGKVDEAVETLQAVGPVIDQDRAVGRKELQPRRTIGGDLSHIVESPSADNSDIRGGHVGEHGVDVIFAGKKG